MYLKRIWPLLFVLLPLGAIRLLPKGLAPATETLGTALPLESVMTTSMSADVPRIIEVGPDSVNLVPVIGKVSFSLTAPDDTKMSASRLLRSAPAAKVASATPAALVCVLTAVKVPVEARKLTMAFGKALLLTSFTKARTSTPSPPVPTVMAEERTSMELGMAAAGLSTTLRMALFLMLPIDAETVRSRLVLSVPMLT